MAKLTKVEKLTKQLKDAEAALDAVSARRDKLLEKADFQSLPRHWSGPDSEELKNLKRCAAVGPEVVKLNKQILKADQKVNRIYDALCRAEVEQYEEQQAALDGAAEEEE
jgi:hypothetical protein